MKNLDTWMLYGANGYSGRLIAQHAVECGLRPILAGRREQEIAPMARRLGLAYRCFGLDRSNDVEQGLQGVRVVLNAAGPYSRTAMPMLDGCVTQRVNYLDLNGDTQIFSAFQARDAELRAAQIVAVPGVGFDIVPTDCLSRVASELLPGATHLEIAWGGDFEPSPGTARSMMEIMPRGGLVREHGELKTVPAAYRTMTVPFPTGPTSAVSVEWGDVVTSQRSVGIPNVIVFAGMPRSGIASLKAMRPVLPLFRTRGVQRLAELLIARCVQGPKATTLQHGVSYVMARVRRGAEAVTATLVGPEGYVITARAAVGAVEHLLAHPVAPGSETPARVFGPQILQRIGCRVHVERSERVVWSSQCAEPPQTEASLFQRRRARWNAEGSE